MNGPQPVAPWPAAPLLDRITDALFAVDTAWRFTYLNRRAADLVGRAPADLVGSVVWEVVPQAVGPPLQAEAQRAMRDQTAARLELHNPATSRWIEIDLYPSPEGMTAFARDVTARHEAEATIRFQAQLLELVGEAAIATDLDGVITYWNAAAERLYGWQAGEVVGRSVFDVLAPPMAREQGEAILGQLRDGRAWSGDFIVLRRDGTSFPALVTDAPVRDAAGQVVGVVGLSSDISDRVRAEAALQASEARYRMLAEQANDIIARFAPDGALLDVSPAVERVLGYPPEAMLTPLAKDLLHPDDRPVIQAMFAAIDAGSGAETMTLRMRHRDGEYRWLECSLRAVRHPATGALTYLHSVARDVTARRRAEREREEASALIDTIFAQAPVGLGFCDRDLRYRRVNPALARMNGLPPEAHIGRTPRELLPGIEAIDAIMAVWQQVIDTGVPALGYEVQGETPSAPGRVGAWQESFFPVRVGDEVIGIGAVVEEVTAQREARAERERLLREERTARAEAEAALRTRDELVSYVSHDLRGPLTAMKGYTQLLRRQIAGDDAPRTDAIEALDQVAAAVGRMERMIDELMDTARLQSGLPLDLEPAPLDIVALVRHVTAAHARGATRHQITVETAVDALTGAWDGSRLARVLDNLLSNAVKYSPGGGPIRVRVAPHVEGDRRCVSLAVEDRGMGVPVADLPRLFERFHRAANAATLPGTGLGLAAVKQIVEQHGGTVAVTSTEGAGTTVTVMLPLD